MKKLLLALLLVPTSLYADSVTPGVGFLQLSTGVYSTRSPGDVQNKNWAIAAASITKALNGSEISTFTVFNLTVVSSVTISSPTVSIGGNKYVFQTTAPVSTDQILHLRDGGNAYWGGDNAGTGGGGGGAIENTTVTYSLKYPGFLMISTQSMTSISSLAIGQSTWNVVSISAFLIKGSTSDNTTVQIIESTGGVNALPFKVYGSRFPPVLISTTRADGYGGWSAPITTGIVINAGSFLGISITSAPTSGRQPEGIDVQINYWKKPFGGN